MQCQIGCGLRDAHPTHHVSEDIAVAHGGAAVAMQDSQLQREPLTIDAHRHATRVAALRRIDQRLQFKQ